jgi:hypothetical protein
VRMSWPRPGGAGGDEGVADRRYRRSLVVETTPARCMTLSREGRQELSIGFACLQRPCMTLDRRYDPAIAPPIRGHLKAILS